MIGIFDSGYGGLTVLQELERAFPALDFMYLGDHANAPYGPRPAQEVCALTCAGVEFLFAQGCKLVLLGCNTATAVALRHMQQVWLPAQQAAGRFEGCNVLGSIAPTVEVATQTPWQVEEPQYPQKFRQDTVAVFGTSLTVKSGVFEEEILKRCPQMAILSVPCPTLAGLIEQGADETDLRTAVEEAVAAALAQMPAQAVGQEGVTTAPDWAILGCTHYPLIEHLFRAALPPGCKLIAQPQAMAFALRDYVQRHPAYARPGQGLRRLLTTGDAARVAGGGGLLHALDGLDLTQWQHVQVPMPQLL